MSRAPAARNRGGSDEPSPPDPKKLPMSVKQLAQTVRYGRKVTFLVFDGDPITGYLGGMEDEYFLVLSPTEDGFEKWVLNRSGNPAFRLHTTATYEKEPQREAMEEIIGPFRGWVIARIFNGRNDTDPRKAG